MGEHPSATDAVRLRDAPLRGLTRGRLRTSRWVRLSHSLHVVRAERTLREQLAALSLVLPRNSGFGHLTSAELRGWWLPYLLGRHIVFATTASGVHVQRRGVYVRRSRLAQYEDVDGIRCVSAAHTLAELACDLSLVDLVPMVDQALASGVAADQILAAARPRSRGAVALRRAVSLADARSESWWESVLRLQHVVTGLGPVECQPEIWADGQLVARADLHLVGTNRYPECDGGEHRDRDRHAHDLGRDKAMARLGLERYGYTAREICRRPEMVIRDGEEARGLASDPDRVRTWWRVARASSLTPYGRTRLAGRLQRYRLAANRRVAADGGSKPHEGNQMAPLDGGE